ncbi:MAG: hypothetical protein JKX85_09010 [Phycisphaeraceae bacterium]|nr:hypothetical protein [Phycisphaeraceae bacterium]
MAWTTMHFAVGMAGATAITGVSCMVMRRGWRWLPLSMTAGGLWALIPDLPRIFREDFTGLPFASTLGSKSLELKLHRMGDVFFFHKQLDIQPHEYALHGLIMILLMYNVSIVALMLLEYCQRNSPIHRSFRAHAPHVKPAYPRSARAQAYQPPHMAMASAPHDNMPPMFTTHLAPALGPGSLENPGTFAYPAPGSQNMSLDDHFAGKAPAVNFPHDPNDPVIGHIGRDSKTGS